METKFVVDYLDTNSKTRWGYITSETANLFEEYLKKIKQQEEEGEGNNEILDTNIKQLARINVKVYLADGTTGSPELRHITIVPPFVHYGSKPKEEPEND